MSDKGGSDSAHWAYQHGGGADRSNTGAAPAVSIHHAYARKLTELNDRELRLGGTIPALLDPRDVLDHVCALALGMRDARAVPPMSLVEALGAQVLALGLAVDRVETGRFDTGGDNAA